MVVNSNPGLPTYLHRDISLPATDSKIAHVLVTGQSMNTLSKQVRPEFFYLLIYGKFFSDLGSGERKKINK